MMNISSPTQQTKCVRHRNFDGRYPFFTSRLFLGISPAVDLFTAPSITPMSVWNSQVDGTARPTIRLNMTFVFSFLCGG